jgi:hypothetical protein
MFAWDARRAVARVAQAALSLAGLGCGQLLGVDQYKVAPESPEEDARASAPPQVSYDDAACGACMEQRCAPETEACTGDAACDPWHRCWAACPVGDGACRHACYDGLPRTNGVMGAIRVCAVRECSEACRPSAVDNMSPECEACAIEQCPAQTAACSGDPGCLGMLGCWFESGHVTAPDPVKATGCNDAHGAYAAVIDENVATQNAYMDYAICFVLACADRCGYGERVDCGNYTFVPPRAPVQVTVRVHESNWSEVPGRAFRDVEVRACDARFDTDCMTPLDRGDTNADGRVTLTIPASALRVSFQVEVEQEGVRVPMIWYPPWTPQVDTELSLNVHPAAHLDRSGLDPPSGVRWTAGTGFVSVAARDCVGAPALDVTFSLRDGDPGVIVAHAPGSPADFLLADVNASSGYSAVFINVSPGRHVIE